MDNKSAIVIIALLIVISTLSVVAYVTIMPSINKAANHQREIMKITPTPTPEPTKAPTATPTPVPTLAPTATPVPVNNSSNATVTPSPMSELPSQPTATQTPTNNPTVTPSPAPTATPSPSPTPVPQIILSVSSWNLEKNTYGIGETLKGSATIVNNGNIPATGSVRFNALTVYSVDASVAGLQPGGTATVNYEAPIVGILPGEYDITVTAAYAGQQIGSQTFHIIIT